MLDYTSITEDFQWKEVGLFALNPDTGAEILYCYGNAGSKGDWITGGTSATAKSINMTALVSSVASVTAVIDNTAIYAAPDLSNVPEAALANRIEQAAQSGSLTPDTIGAIGADKIGQPGGVAKTSTQANITLLASGWVAGLYTFTNADITPTSPVELIPAQGITASQLKALQKSSIVDGGQTAGSATLKALGDVPTVDIPVVMIIRGDL